MARWNPITGFVGQKLSLALTVLFAGLAVLTAYAWHVTRSNWMGIFFGLSLMLSMSFAAGFIDVNRRKKGLSPYLSHLVLSIAVVSFGIWLAIHIDNEKLSVIVLCLGFGGAAVFALFSVVSLKGMNVYVHHWNALSVSLALFLANMLNGARIADKEEDIGAFFYISIPLSVALSIVVFFWFRSLSKKREIKYAFEDRLVNELIEK